VLPTVPSPIGCIDTFVAAGVMPISSDSKAVRIVSSP